MKFLVAFIIFIIILFFYCHIWYHLKTSDDLEMYEIEKPSKEKLENLCDLRQPILIKYNDDKLNNELNIEHIFNTYCNFDIKMRNTKELDDDNKKEKYIPLVLKNAVKLFNGDKESKYITENNSDFIEETGLIKTFKSNDFFIRPYMVASCEYDIIKGSEGSIVPLKYDLNYRNYLYINSGEVTIKITPPKNSKYLYSKHNYNQFDEDFEFNSLINVWNPQEKYLNDYNKVKFLELTCKKGDLLYIPSYWWYSIKLNNNSCILNFKYKTYMNIISILPQITLYNLQKLNIKFTTEKKFDMDLSGNITSNNSLNSSQ